MASAWECVTDLYVPHLIGHVNDGEKETIRLKGNIITFPSSLVQSILWFPTSVDEDTLKL